MGIITELTFRLASNERDPDKPFGAQLRTSCAFLLIQQLCGLLVVFWWLGGLTLHARMPAYGACLR